MLPNDTEVQPLGTHSCEEGPVKLFSLLGNRIRFQLVCLLFTKERCVSELVDAIEDAKEPNVSQQLKILASNGILQRRKEGRRAIYSLQGKEAREFIFLLNQYYKGGRKK